MPFFIIVVILVIIIYGWKSLNNVFIDENRSTVSEKVFLNIESGSAKAMTVGKSEWQNAPDKIYLYRGERLKTGSDGRATLTFFDQSIMRLNTSTEVAFASLKKKNDFYDTKVELEKGDTWLKISPISNPDSTFSVTTDLLTIDTKGAVFAVSSPGTVYVTQGNAQVGVKYDDEVIKTFTVGVGQQFIADLEAVESLRRGDSTEVIFALSDQFKKTNWYRWNVKKDGAINAFEEPEPDEDEFVETQDPASDTDEDETLEDIANIGRIVYVTKPSKGLETNENSVSIEGKFDAEKINAVYVNGEKADITNGNSWSAPNIWLGSEGENTIKIEAEDISGEKITLDPVIVIYDKTPPEAPVVTVPEIPEGEDSFAVEDVDQVIEGIVSEDTQAVIVNDYRLSLYVPGSKEFAYYARTEYGNLAVGENEYKVYAEDKAGNKSEPATIMLTLDQEVVDTAEAEKASDSAKATSDTEDEEGLPQATTKGGVKITGPNGGESFLTTGTEFEITGTVPANTETVKVNDYRLNLFSPGDRTFVYRASSPMKNLTIGEKNQYFAEAFDVDGGLIGAASITIDVESGSQAAPVIIIPTSSGSYSTTLDTIVIGGTVGKWVTRMYVNNKELREYIPGSEEWKTSVTLSSGTTTYTVTAEKQGEEVGEDKIEVTYTP